MKGALSPAGPRGEVFSAEVGYRVRPYRRGDFVTIWRALTAAGVVGLVSDPRGADETYASQGPAFTAFTADGVPLACAGMLVRWPGMGDAWFVPTIQGLRDHPVAIARMTRRRLLTMARGLKLWRLQAEVIARDGPESRFAKWVGFEHEGCMPLYGRNRERWCRWVMFPEPPGPGEPLRSSTTNGSRLLPVEHVNPEHQAAD